MNTIAPVRRTLTSRNEVTPTLDRVRKLNEWLNTRVVGQPILTQRLIIALLCGGHLLVEGAPGLAKTRVIKELARGVQGDFHRIQFTPDLLPSDVTGTEVFRPEDGTFHFQQGPIFHNLLLADEVNRAPAKVQSALLEGMAEHQVTQGRQTFRLPELFLVMATQNPIEQEGTYPLPEAQLDRFLMHIQVGYPPPQQELRILRIARDEILSDEATPPLVLEEKEIFEARKEISELHMADSIERYIVALVTYTRSSSIEGVEYGASPRATIALDLGCRTVAWLDGRAYVSPEDVHNVVHDVMRHRIILSFEAEAQGITADAIVDESLKMVPVP
ncbi:MAG: AAA family ATPase [Gammaproteobacteria bacterium]|nr:AAA family ATPase [Gammaproteobacteria bacterium]